MSEPEETPPRAPGRMTLALERIDRLEEATDVRERPEAVDEVVASMTDVQLARIQAMKEILTGPNAKWFALLFAFIFGVPTLMVGSWATGHGFQLGLDGLWFGATPADDAAPAEGELEEYPPVQDPTDE